jgi:hypothetical protein
MNECVMGKHRTGITHFETSDRALVAGCGGTACSHGRVRSHALAPTRGDDVACGVAARLATSSCGGAYGGALAQRNQIKGGVWFLPLNFSD